MKEKNNNKDLPELTAERHNEISGLILGYMLSPLIPKDDLKRFMQNPDFQKGFKIGVHGRIRECIHKTTFRVALERFNKLPVIHRDYKPRLKFYPPEHRFTRKIARQFLKKMNNYLPHSMPTREDLYQEAYIGYLLALKTFDPWKGTPDFNLKDSIKKYLWNIYKSANAEKRKSETKKYQLQYIPEYSETYQEPDSGIFKSLNPYKDDDGNTISFKREKTKESFEVYDEQEYKEPDEVKQFYKHDFLLPDSTRDAKGNFSIEGFKIINLPPGCYEAVSPNKKTFMGEVCSRKGKIKQAKITIREFMKNAEKRLGGGIPICEYIEGEKITEHNIPAAKGGYIPYLEQPLGFKDLKQEAWELIQTFPDDQRQFFNIFYNDDNHAITRKAVARIMKIGDSNIKTFIDDGIQRLRKHFKDVYGVNVIRDTTEKKVEGKTYPFKTTWELSKK